MQMGKYHRITGTAIALLTGFLLSVQPVSGMDIIKEGKAACVIVIPAKPLPAERFAADELRYHLNRSGATDFQIVPEPVLASRHSLPKGRIYIGRCRATADAGISPEKMRRFSGMIRQTGNRLFLVGRDEPGDVLKGLDFLGTWRKSAGTVIAVYDLLEKEFKIRWLWPGELGESIPTFRNFRLGETERVAAPKLRQSRLRLVNWGNAGWNNPDNAARFRQAQLRWLCRQRFCLEEDLSYGHGFKDYWNRFGKTHPKYFSMLPDGRRGLLPGGISGRAMLCVSNPALHHQILADHQAATAALPPSESEFAPQNVINLCENDSPALCTCPQCRAWDAPQASFATHPYWGKGVIPTLANRFPALGSNDGAGSDKEAPSLSDRMARFYLTVQAAADKIKPGMVVFGYAYANYAAPPLRVKLNERVIISFVGWPFYPFTADRMAAARKDWDGWRAAGVRLVLRPNSMLVGHNLPVFYAVRLGNEYRHAWKHGMIGSDFDSLTGQWATQGPSLYTMGRLNSRPDLTVEAILDEYYTAFGPAAAAVKDYFTHWEKVSDSMTDAHWQKVTEKLGRISFKNWLNAGNAMFPPEAMQEGRRLIKAALHAADSDIMATRRVAFLESGLTHAELTLAALTAQQKLQAQPSAVNRKAFAEALEKLRQFRRQAEADGIADMGYLFRYEKNGSGWWK